MSEKKFHEYSVKDITGQEYNFDQLKGKVVLIVNVASKCGFTKQYTGLEKLYQDYNNNGQDFVILGFPCNQFGSQEPDTEENIQKFCKNTYNVSFPMFSKIEVNGSKAEPLYENFLTKWPAHDDKKNVIKWNFTKFLIDREGNIIKRYEPGQTPESIEGDISKLVKGETLTKL
ncbi:glutathione peroxidase [Gigaspora margarita]|uniref:Glutathione peroxidase n=1 Tax=Gigaspora margarita TaxID=4874 RepID=A0A8H4AT23_GIGMA|nr:glutathione peroxidase [Gigaspora margarita]